MRYHHHGRDDGLGGEVMMRGVQGGQLRMSFTIDLERLGSGLALPVGVGRKRKDHEANRSSPHVDPDSQERVG